MKKRISVYLSIVMLMVFFSTGITVMADENYTEKNKDSIVQVVVQYAVDGGETIVLQSGSGIVVDSNTVLTNYHLVHLTKRIRKKTREYILGKTGADVDLKNDNGVSISVVNKGDKLISAEIVDESQEDDFCMLTLSEEIERSAAALGDSDTVSVPANVIAIGYPTMDAFKENVTFFKPSDVNLVTGVVSEVTNENIRVGTKISKGNSGGALIDASSGAVVGMLVFDSADNKKECFRALPINHLKEYMQNIAYTDVSAAEKTTQEEVSTEEVVVPTDRTKLDAAIAEAEQKDKALYTEESYTMMTSCLEQAKIIQQKKEAVQDEIDAAEKLLNDGIGNLEEVSTFNWTIVIIGASVVLVILIIIIIVIVCVTSAKQKKKNEFTTIPGNAAGAYSGQNNMQMPNTPGGTPPMNGAGGSDAGKVGATTVLKPSESNKSQGTTVLNSGPMQMSAYFVRTKTNERNMITSQEYIVGKDAAVVHYCIADNAAVSRCHMKIVKRGMNYFLIDLNSTNNTYLNGKRVMPNKEQVLNSGDVISVADEEFVFEIK
ncbi:MAG: trypsin-like peptidase domain-containing protein [Bacteroidales bacterium]|nr:trypsin-like peptidase domain-containing protein [Clostridium sp.]MCM1204248.1 trypsin-like peptidase domain-containing protein [Bacteroidales bacterium]